ncbi:hypothetical protein VNO80_06746 [Phaseolus coccineus]|uniref:Uncharacterized protein n=1 Tax=Phaseolus coccineus TaxID=3886 RepID=A0AAN9NM75_PHACN
MIQYRTWRISVSQSRDSNPNYAFTYRTIFLDSLGESRESSQFEANAKSSMSLDSRFEGKEGSYQFEACELVIPLLDIDIMGIPFSFLRFVNLETDYALRSPTPLWLLAFITFPGLEFAWLVLEFDPLLAYRIVNLLLPSLSSVLSESPRASSGFSQYGCFLGSASLSVKKIRMPPGLPIGSPTHPPAIQYRPHPLSQILNP